MEKKKVLVIGWDAADWKAIHPLMDAGRMPNLQKLVERGSMGRVATLHPPLSPMLWTSIATGKRPFKHGIHGFSEPTADGRGVRPVTNLSRTCKAVWNILSQHGLRSNVIGWWPSHPAEPIRGAMVSDQYHKAHQPLGPDWRLPPHAVHPAELHDTLAELRLHPQELMGPMLEPFVPLLEKVDQKQDRRFAGLCKTIAECASIHSAATWLMENREWDFFAVYYDAIDHFCHGFMKYHRPRQPWIDEADFELYSNVVSTAYVLHDQMLGTLLEKAGPETTVILMSDHGFHPDHLRPNSIPDMPAGPAIEHSPYGIFVMAGPGIKKDASLFGVSVLDLTPTVLSLYGLPAGEDMDGRVVTAAFEHPPDTGTIASWEDVAPLEGCTDGRHPAHTRLDPVASAEAMEQLAALGYIERPGPDIEEYVESTVRELKYNLVEAYQDGNRHSEALEIARDLCLRDPDEQRFALKRFVSCQALGLAAEMREIVDDMDGRRRAAFEAAGERLRELGEASGEQKEVRAALRLRRYTPAVTDLLQAQTLVAEKRWFEALEALKKAGGARTVRPGILLQSADLLRRLGRLPESEALYRRALMADPDNAHAWLGLGRLALVRREFAAAEAALTECVGRLFFYPMAHFLRAVARARRGLHEEARKSLETALSQNPHFPQAHLWLGRLLKFRLNDAEGAEEHFRWYREMRLRKPVAPGNRHGDGEPEDSPSADLSPSDLQLPPLDEEVLVVCGLPRSGTSMLMQMLHAGGMPILSDGLREADEDNPRGYFELEAVKAIFRDREASRAWLGGACGKAVKIVAPLVCSLPPGCRYRVILIDRNYDEILASQAKMIARRGEAVADSQQRRSRLRHEYARVMERTKAILSARPEVRLLRLHYDEVLREPARAAESINRFTGGVLNGGLMAAAIDRSLHRNVARAAAAG
jgi:predicted AlkP superfamily phosphohydrolase/phosphomutase/tetratricopeptide (TPR) repeat protein